MLALLMGCASAATSAAPDNEVNQARLDRTVAYLQHAQNMDGGFGGNAGAPSDPDFSAWAALALAAAGINPQDQKQPGGVDVYTYLAEHAHELKVTTDFERELLVVDASGTSPHDFGGVDLVHEILQRQMFGVGKDGAFPHEAGGQTPGVNDTIFAILALSPVIEPDVNGAVQQAVNWVLEVHNPKAGWAATTVCATQTRGCVSNVDMTGAAIEALNAAGRRDTPAQEEAFDYLHKAQSSDGGFPQQTVQPEESNVASTAWVVQGMWSAGQNPETWVKGLGTTTGEPLGYMASLQQPDGHIRYQTQLESLGEWMTAEVAPTFAGQALPIPAVARSELASDQPPPGPGVNAGGGGAGAPLFSRPQPQSQGRIPGGVRLLKSKRRRTPSKSFVKHRPNPGPLRRASAPTSVIPAEASINHHGVHTGTGSSASGPREGGVARPLLASAGTSGDGSAAASEGREVKGVLIAAPATTVATRGALEPGAPGLRSAGTGGGQGRWLAIGIGALIALLIFAGSQLERKRPQVML